MSCKLSEIENFRTFRRSPLASNAQMISNDNCLATEVSINKRFWMSDDNGSLCY